MNLDYSSAKLADDAHRRSVRRSVLAAALCAVSIASLASRQTTASRPSANSLPVDEITTAFPASAPLEAQSAHDESIQAATVDPQPVVPQASEWITLTVRPGQTISTLIEEQGMQKHAWMELMALGKEASKLRALRAGEKILLRKNAEDKLEELLYEIDEARTLHVQRAEDQLEAYILAAEIEHRTAQTAGVIDSSLFADGRKAGLSNQLVMDLAEIFGYDIDFALDLRSGDRFAVIHEELYKNGEKLRDGKILAAEFTNQGRSYRAMRHVGKNGQVAYYTPTGQALRKAFFRTPLDFVRITSNFNLKRRHPILNIIRAHKGVDYAAQTGTPIKATGDAQVAFIGVKGGYGKVVILQHGSQYTTLYGHLSRFRSGLRVGSKVNRGQVIGYVGRSGLATAAHLHYEFRINGVHVNPVKTTMARASGLAKSELALWRQSNSALIAQLDSLTTNQVAQLKIAKRVR